MAIFRSFWEDFQYSLRTGNMVTKLVVINFTVFVAVNIAYVALWIGHLGQDVTLVYWDAIDYLCISANWREVLWRPWTIFTNFFLHVEFWHFVNNMFGLYLFGTIVGDLVGDRRVLPVYLLGGLAGGAFFFISANLSPTFGMNALGASAAVMALAGASVTMAPEYRLPLLFLGEVKVKYIVLVFVLLDLVGIAGSSGNSGGHIAHLGGFLMGCLIVFRLRDGKDMAEPVNRVIDWIGSLFSSRSSGGNKQKRKQKTAIKASMGTSAKGSNVTDSNDLSYQGKLDAILERIKEAGYENLTQEEKDFLYDASKK
jgi:membrane associated rhomboid family serine protease